MQYVIEGHVRNSDSGNDSYATPAYVNTGFRMSQNMTRNVARLLRPFVKKAIVDCVSPPCVISPHLRRGVQTNAVSRQRSSMRNIERFKTSDTTLKGEKIFIL